MNTALLTIDDFSSKNTPAIVDYLKEKGIHKVDDTRISCSWWKENGLHTDMDTFWNLDFDEYMIRQGRIYSTFSW